MATMAPSGDAAFDYLLGNVQGMLDAKLLPAAYMGSGKYGHNVHLGACHDEVQYAPHQHGPALQKQELLGFLRLHAGTASGGGKNHVLFSLHIVKSRWQN